jgi:hypothetical protein
MCPLILYLILCGYLKLDVFIEMNTALSVEISYPIHFPIYVNCLTIACDPFVTQPYILFPTYFFFKACSFDFFRFLGTS